MRGSGEVTRSELDGMPSLRDGRDVLRAVAMNPMTGGGDLDRFLEILRETAGRLPPAG